MARIGTARIGELLIARGISRDHIQSALETQARDQRPIGQILIDSGAATEDDILSAWAEQLGIKYISEIVSVDGEALKKHGAEWFSKLNAVPISRDPSVIALADPADRFIVDDLRKHFGDFTPCVSSIGIIRTAIEGWMRESGTPIALSIEPLEDDASVSKWVDHLLERAVEERASDIHIEALGDCTQIRFRIDGVLYEVPPPPLRLHNAVISRIKVLSDLNIAERRLPQDGKFPRYIANKPHDVRVSVLPGIHGEDATLRLLERTGGISFDDLGFSEEIRRKIEPIFLRNHGLILATGPTGSGKSTTLNAALQRLNDISRKIITIEDPVEYELRGVKQIQVHPQIGLTFAHGLRSILRSDPEVILVGEIRDSETADIAIRAALTGHLVPTTLHTNDAISSVARLIDMKIDRFLVASALVGVLAQRLVRRLCPECRAEIATPDEVRPLFSGARLPIPESVFRNKGCLACGGRGFRGRIVIAECLIVDEAVREAIYKTDCSSQNIREASRRQNFRPLLADGLEKCRIGQTTIDEVLRVALPEGPSIAE